MAITLEEMNEVVESARRCREGNAWLQVGVAPLALSVTTYEKISKTGLAVVGRIDVEVRTDIDTPAIVKVMNLNGEYTEEDMHKFARGIDLAYILVHLLNRMMTKGF